MRTKTRTKQAESGIALWIVIIIAAGVLPIALAIIGVVVVYWLTPTIDGAPLPMPGRVENGFVPLREQAPIFHQEYGGDS